MARCDIGSTTKPGLRNVKKREGDVVHVANSMRAVVQDGGGSPDVLQLRDIDVPAIGDDRVLVRVRAASVNASDYHVIRGGWLVSVMGKLLARGQQQHPVRGGDLAGTVEAVGANVTTLKAGDSVFGVGRGSWAEYATASERTLLIKPGNLSFVEAAAVGGAGVTALQALRDHGKTTPGQRVLVYGAGGGVGTFAVQIAQALGAHVTAVTSARNIEIVQSLGPDALLDYTTENVAKRAERYDVVLDVAGTRPLGELLGLLAPGGRLVAVGAAKGRGMMGIAARLVAAMVRMRLLKQPVVSFIASIRRDDLAFLKDLIEAGKLRPAIDRTYPLSETREAVRYAMSGQGRAKVVITVP